MFKNSKILNVIHGAIIYGEKYAFCWKWKWLPNQLNREWIDLHMAYNQTYKRLVDSWDQQSAKEGWRLLSTHDNPTHRDEMKGSWSIRAKWLVVVWTITARFGDLWLLWPPWRKSDGWWWYGPPWPKTIRDCWPASATSGFVTSVEEERQSVRQATSIPWEDLIGRFSSRFIFVMSWVGWTGISNMAQ